MGRIGQPEEIAATRSATLLSDDSGFLTGQTTHRPAAA